jgi:CRP-like cAMP-binding protein
LDKARAIASLLKGLSFGIQLDEEDRRAIEALPMRIERRGPNETIHSTGERPSSCCLVASGFLIRSKTVADGKRQIFAFHQPGDLPDLHSLFLHVLDHELSTLDDCMLGFIPHGALRELVGQRPAIAAALWRDTLIDAAMFREWICNVGQRPGISRLAHLILEIYTRLKSGDATNRGSFRFPATQEILGEAIGMSTVHVNRILQELKANGLLQVSHGEVTILDEQRLRRVADFDPLYLYLNPHADTAPAL